MQVQIENKPSLPTNCASYCRADCDRVTGVCNCLPNVVGEYCDTCLDNHWKIASGEGCEACGCDPVGSTGEACDLYTGQCECRQVSRSIHWLVSLMVYNSRFLSAGFRWPAVRPVRGELLGRPACGVHPLQLQPDGGEPGGDAVRPPDRRLPLPGG